MSDHPHTRLRPRLKWWQLLGIECMFMAALPVFGFIVLCAHAWKLRRASHD